MKGLIPYMFGSVTVGCTEGRFLSSAFAGRGGMLQPPIDDYLINVLAVTVLSNLCLLKIVPK